jgi:hypothetical protein
MKLSHFDDFERMGIKAVHAAMVADLFSPSVRRQARLWLASRPRGLTFVSAFVAFWAIVKAGLAALPMLHAKGSA